MPNDPCPLAFGLTSLKLLDEPLQDTGLVRVCEVEVIEDIVYIPEVCIYGYDTKPLSGGVCISTVVERCLVSFRCGDPTVL